MLKRKIVDLVKHLMEKTGKKAPFSYEDLVEFSIKNNVKVKEIDTKEYNFLDSNTFEGMLVGKGGNAVILLNKNKKKYAGRFNFTVAHELGHYFLHYKRNMKEKIPPDTIETFQRKVYTDRKEFEANLFAAELLMPTEIIKKHWFELEKDYPDEWERIDKLADIFNVSPLAMRYRVENLGLFDPNRYEEEIPL